MDNVFLPYMEQFMLSPLVTWVKTFGENDEIMQFDFTSLMDGMFLNKIMVEINPKATLQSVNKVSKDAVQRVHNLSVLLRQIKTYYLETLRQLIMMPLPNVQLLGKVPYCEQSLEEMNKLLLLLLGCAVQSEKKEEYIERIQTLDYDTKAAIAVHIQEVTHSQDSVLDMQWLEASELHPDDLEVVSRNMALHLRRLVDQRDSQQEIIAELMQERVPSPPSSPPSVHPSGCPSMQQQQHTGAQQHLAVELADSKAKIRRLRQELEEKSEQVLDCRQELDNSEAELKKIQQENSQLLADARAARTYRDELDALRERAIRADKLESEVGRYREKLHNMEFYKAKLEEQKEDNQVLLETKAVLEQQVEGWRVRSDKLHQLEKQNLLLNARVHDMEQEKEVDHRRLEELQGENLALCLAQRRSMDESQLLGWELEQLAMTADNSEGQQSLSEEVSERHQSRLLKLEKENQSLVMTIEELRTACYSQPSHNGGQHPPTVPLGGRWSDSFIALTEQHSGPQICTVELQNGTESPPKYAASHPRQSGRSRVRRQPEEPEGESESPLHEDQEKAQLEERETEDLKDLTSDLEAREKDNDGLGVGCRARSGSTHRDCSDMLLLTRSCYATKHTERLEAKCRALDTENQRLQAAMDNTGRKLQRLEAEVQELEAENQSLQAALEELRISGRKLEQLERDNQSLEQENSALERDKRRLEKENRRLKQQAEIQDSTLDSSNLRLATLERDNRCLGKELEGLKETAERVKGLERDNRELAKQGAIDQRTLSTLREELVSEKLKTQQRDNELERLVHELEMRVLNQDALQTDQETPDNSRFKMLESELESSLKRSLQIKEDKMAALEARLQESSTLNQQLRQELKTVKLNYEALQQREEEQRAASDSAPPRETDRVVNQWQRESQEATRELLKVKDRLIEVERNNATLQAERQALQAQLRQLEAQSDSLHAQILALQRQTASLQESNTALQTHNANLQVEKSTLNSQSASLLAQNAQLQRQQAGAESERESGAREREELRGVQEQLLRDHERLAALHERQAMEYEALMGKHGCLKNVHRTLELEHRTLQDRYKTLLQQQAQLEVLEKALRDERDKMAEEKEQHRSTAAECRMLRDEKDWLNQTHRQLVKDIEELQADHKNLKSLLNTAKLDHTRLENDFSKLREQNQQLDITSTKLTNQCELLSQLKGNLEEENRHLLGQIQTLMLQNRTLLEQTMESKDLFHVEQRQHIDKLNELRRQKEKLEEKIMDQYKFYDPSPPRRRGNWIALKMRKLIKPRSRERGRERGRERSLTPTRSGSCEVIGGSPLPCHDNGSFIGSDGSGGSASTSVTGALSPQRSSTALRIFPLMRNRLKDRDKVKSLFRRSMSLCDLVHPSALSEDHWAASSEQLQGTEVEEDGKDMFTSSLASSILSILDIHATSSSHLHSTSTTPTLTAASDISELWVTDKDSNDSAVASGFEGNSELKNHGLNGAPSWAQSESSGEFSLSLDNEPWSNGSSPVQQPPSRRSSSCHPPSGTSTPQHKEKTAKTSSSPVAITNTQTLAHSTPKQKEGSMQDLWPSRKSFKRSVRRQRHSGEGSAVIAHSSGSASLKSVSRQPETTRASACSPITVLYVQGKSSSVSGCLNCFSTPLGKEVALRRQRSPNTLPRASSVISTAEGSSRRCSVNSDCRVTAAAKMEALPANISEDIENHNQGTANENHQQESDSNKSELGLLPPIKPPRDPAVAVATDRPLSPPPGNLFGSPFTFNSVFSDTIFSESSVRDNLEENETNQTFLCLNQSLVQNVSCATLKPESTKDPTAQTKLCNATDQIPNDTLQGVRQ
ncbi:girdin-like [Aplochiton taeniatus]